MPLPAGQVQGPSSGSSITTTTSASLGSEPASQGSLAACQQLPPRPRRSVIQVHNLVMAPKVRWRCCAPAVGHAHEAVLVLTVCGVWCAQPRHGAQGGRVFLYEGERCRMLGGLGLGLWHDARDGTGHHRAPGHLMTGHLGTSS